MEYYSRRVRKSTNKKFLALQPKVCICITTRIFSDLSISFFLSSDALASDEDEIDEEGQQYLEKLEKSVNFIFTGFAQA